MKISIAICLFACCAFLVHTAGAQHSWKLSKESKGIRVYTSPTNNSPYNSIKLECTFAGNYDALLAIINNVPGHKKWVYNVKTTKLLKRVSPFEFYYYTETALPWPMSNRDCVIHTRIKRDSLNRFLTIQSVDHTGLVPEKSGKVRVQRSNINWLVTMPAANTLHIVYTVEVDPGGGAPAWMVNGFADKGPYESFKKLEELLRQ